VQRAMRRVFRDSQIAELPVEDSSRPVTGETISPEAVL